MTHCTLISGTYDQFIQLLLGILSISVLLVKRLVENPRRSWRIWFLDTSKQIIGAIFAHTMNLILAIFFTVTANSKDECAFYFINFFLDTTFGIFISYSILVCFKKIFQSYNQCQYILISGQYGDNKSPSLFIWFLQLFLWLIVIVITKTLIGIAIYYSRSYLAKFGDMLFQPLKESPKLELLLIMIILPSILNAFQFWIQDNFLRFNGIKRQNSKREENENIPLMDL